MRQSLIPVLILATVALSSSNVLPLSINNLKREQAGLDGQNDNIYFSDRYQTRNILDDLFYKMYVEHQNRPGYGKADFKYASMDNNGDDDIFSIMNKNDNYDGEGFQQEQWHNYPRQLDRLHDAHENDDKRNFDPDPGNEAPIDETAPNIQNMNDISNEFHVDSNAGTNNIYEAAVAANPLLILKIRLAYLNKDIDDNDYADPMTTKVEDSRKEDEKDEFTNANPSMNIIKVKREGHIERENPTTENKAVKKRIFSLWSRLQTLNHKGHELHHRRHLHAFYSLPDYNGGGGGPLTAEPRAILMRPPGSPLRWG